MSTIVISTFLSVVVLATLVSLVSSEGRKAFAASAGFSGILLVAFYPLAGAGVLLLGAVLVLPDVLAEL